MSSAIPSASVSRGPRQEWPIPVHLANGRLDSVVRCGDRGPVPYHLIEALRHLESGHPWPSVWAIPGSSIKSIINNTRALLSAEEAYRHIRFCIHSETSPNRATKAQREALYGDRLEFFETDNIYKWAQDNSNGDHDQPCYTFVLTSIQAAAARNAWGPAVQDISSAGGSVLPSWVAGYQNAILVDDERDVVEVADDMDIDVVSILSTDDEASEENRRESAGERDAVDVVSPFMDVDEAAQSGGDVHHPGAEPLTPIQHPAGVLDDEETLTVHFSTGQTALVEAGPIDQLPHQAPELFATAGTNPIRDAEQQAPMSTLGMEPISPTREQHSPLRRDAAAEETSSRKEADKPDSATFGLYSSGRHRAHGHGQIEHETAMAHSKTKHQEIVHEEGEGDWEESSVDGPDESSSESSSESESEDSDEGSGIKTPRVRPARKLVDGEESSVDSSDESSSESSSESESEDSDKGSGIKAPRVGSGERVLGHNPRVRVRGVPSEKLAKTVPNSPRQKVTQPGELAIKEEPDIMDI